MSSRKALLDLQQRLAAKMQQAKSVQTVASWLAVEAESENLLLPLELSGEISAVDTLMSVSYTKSWFLGVSNIRGQIFGVVDAAGYLTGKPLALEKYRKTARLVAFNNALEINCALLISNLQGLKSAEDFVSYSEAGSDDPAYVMGYYKDVDGKEWKELDLQELAQVPEFLRIAA